MQTALALVLAFASTALVNLAYVREHDAVGTLPALSLRRPLQSLRMLLGSRDWLVAFAMEALGFALYVVALALAPLALVQSVAAGGVGLLAFAVARTAHRRLTPREAVGAGVAVAGLLLLSLSLSQGSDTDGGSPGAIVASAVWLGGTVAAALAVLALRARFGVALASGIAGGLLFSCGDICMKLATQGGVRLLFACAAVLAYVLGTSLLQVGYQTASALTIAGVATLLTNALPIAAGPVLFAEPLPSGALGVLRVLAFAAVVAGATILARPKAADPRAAAVSPG